MPKTGAGGAALGRRDPASRRSAPQAFWEQGRPQSILLVTGPGGQGGIACDRALQLARQWKARLVHLGFAGPGEVPAAADGAHPGSAEAASDGGDAGYRVVAGSGDAGDEALRLLDETRAELLVIEADRRRVVDGLSAPSPADRLVRASRCPVLVVKQPATAAYRRILVATDYSRPSASCLESLPAFPLADATLAHAYHEPFREWDGSGGRGITAEAASRSAQRGFLADLTPSTRARLALWHQRGIVPDVLAQAVIDGGHDLAVVGRTGRGSLGLSLLGRTAQALLAGLPCDILIASKAQD